MTFLAEDKESIRDLLARYCFYTDSGQFEKMVALFVENGVWDGGPFGQRRGRADILAMLRQGGDAAGKLRHHNSNLLIEVSDREAHVTSYVAVFNVADAATGIFFAGCYIDHLTKIEGRWLFAQRKIRTDLAEAGLL